MGEANSSCKKKSHVSQHNSAKATLLGSSSSAGNLASQACKVAQATLSKNQRQKMNRRLRQFQLQTRAALAQKIIVSNLPRDVTEAQLQELFAYSIGPTVQVTLHHDNSGRFTGVAAVVFSRSGDATRALQEYNNRLIDGNLMKVELVLDTCPPAHEPALSRRIGPAPATSQGKAAPPAAPAHFGKGWNKNMGGGWRWKNKNNTNSTDSFAVEMASLLRFRDQARNFLNHFPG